MQFLGVLSFLFQNTSRGKMIVGDRDFCACSEDYLRWLFAVDGANFTANQNLEKTKLNTRCYLSSFLRIVEKLGFGKHF